MKLGAGAITRVAMDTVGAEFAHPVRCGAFDVLGLSYSAQLTLYFMCAFSSWCVPLSANWGVAALLAAASLVVLESPCWPLAVDSAGRGRCDKLDWLTGLALAGAAQSAVGFGLAFWYDSLGCSVLAKAVAWAVVGPQLGLNVLTFIYLRQHAGSLRNPPGDGRFPVPLASAERDVEGA